MLLGRVQVPATVKKGEPFEVRIVVQHAMETGYRRDLYGKAIPTNIVDKLSCTIGGREVFRVELGTGIAANPYFSFHAVADASGEVVVEWSDDLGERGRATADLHVQ